MASASGDAFWNQWFSDFIRPNAHEKEPVCVTKYRSAFSDYLETMFGFGWLMVQYRPSRPSH
jgi:hypothetical protein